MQRYWKKNDGEKKRNRNGRVEIFSGNGWCCALQENQVVLNNEIMERLWGKRIEIMALEVIMLLLSLLLLRCKVFFVKIYVMLRIGRE